MPTLLSSAAYPPILASTLATFDEVVTLPETIEPGEVMVGLSEALNICGGAFGAAITGAGAAAGGAAAGGVAI